MIVELPPSYRAVVLLRDLEELTTEETAQILDLGIDVVKTRLHRGRAAMRQKLDCYLNNHCLEDQPSPNPRASVGGGAGKPLFNLGKARRSQLNL